jgi:hypothetical protein
VLMDMMDSYLCFGVRLHGVKFLAWRVIMLVDESVLELLNNGLCEIHISCFC